MTEIAVMTNGTEIRHLPCPSEDYFALLDEGWEIEDIIEEPASFARWADGSIITARDVESRPGQVRVREDLHTLKAACDRLGLDAWEGDSYGSRYLYIEAAGRTLKARISDHARCSALHDLPDFNIAPGCATVEAVINELAALAAH